MAILVVFWSMTEGSCRINRQTYYDMLELSTDWRYWKRKEMNIFSPTWLVWWPRKIIHSVSKQVAWKTSSNEAVVTKELRHFPTTTWTLWTNNFLKTRTINHLLERAVASVSSIILEFMKRMWKIWTFGLPFLDAWRSTSGERVE